jgi:hypothetical protein
MHGFDTHTQGLTGGSGDDKRHEYALFTDAKGWVVSFGDDTLSQAWLQFALHLRHLSGGEVVQLFVEVACNGMFGVGNNGFIQPPDPDRTFTLAKAAIAGVNAGMPFRCIWESSPAMGACCGSASSDWTPAVSQCVVVV